MSSTIATRIVAAVSPICTVYADEAETRQAPYAVYTINEEGLYDMDGLCGWEATVELALCATSFDSADELADQAITAIEELRDTLGVKLTGRQPYESAEAKVYVVILSYTFKEAA